MPYKDGKKFRGVVTIKGKRVAQQLFRTKREASAWEKETKDAYLNQTRMGSLVDIGNEYLDYVQRNFAKDTYSDKKRELDRGRGNSQSE